MAGMNSGLSANDPAVVAAFRTALIHQGIVALLIFLLVSAVWAGARGWLAPMSGAGQAAGRAAAWTAEPPGRRLLRIGFGLLWIFDGLLQAQPAMAVGLPSQVIEPLAASSPRWVQAAPPTRSWPGRSPDRAVAERPAPPSANGRAGAGAGLDVAGGDEGGERGPAPGQAAPGPGGLQHRDRGGRELGPHPFQV